MNPGTMTFDQINNMLRVLEDVRAERYRQHAKWGEQNHPDGTGGVHAVHQAEMAKDSTDRAARNGQLTFRLIADEEVAEANAETDQEKLRAELVQAAAVYVAWIEAVDRRRAQKKEEKAE